MDTQIKINIKTFYNNRYNFRDDINFSLDRFYELYSENTIFEFKEYDKFEMKFICNDENVFMKIESYYNQSINQVNDDSNKYDVDNNMVVIKPGETIELSPGGYSENILVPGNYSIQIYRDKECFNGFFCVSPHSLSWNAITNIKQYLEEKVKGLSYNIYMQKKANKEIEEYAHKDIEAYKYLYSIQDELLNLINRVTNNPILDIKKKYIAKEYSRKQDTKSQRWLLKKGTRYSSSSNIGTYKLYYEKHSYSSNDTVENIILKRMLNYMQSILIEAESEYMKILKSIQKHTRELEVTLIEKINLYEQASKLPNTNEVNRIRKKQINGLENEIKSYKEKESLSRGNFDNIYRLKGNLNYYINETWIKDIELKYNTPDVTTRILKNYNYNEIYLIYRNLMSSNCDGSFDVSFPNKQTYKLFEIYSFLITKDIFEELGFVWTEGWLKSVEIGELFNGDLVSGDSIIMVKDNYKLIIAYDIYIGTPEELRNVKLSQPSTKTDNHHRKPDILISLYKGTKLLGCEVIEVKYRRKSNIYNDKDIDTDVCKQLSAYTGFDYYDAQKGRVIREKPVYKVLTLYPKQDDSSQQKHSIYDIEFIPIMPYNENLKMYYGYENLKNELEEFLLFFYH